VHAGNIKEIITRFNFRAIELSTAVVCIATDGTTTMKKLGRISGIEQQLGIVHGIQLPVLDTLYVKPRNGRILEMIPEDEYDGEGNDNGKC